MPPSRSFCSAAVHRDAPDAVGAAAAAAVGEVRAANAAVFTPAPLDAGGVVVEAATGVPAAGDGAGVVAVASTIGVAVLVAGEALTFAGVAPAAAAPFFFVFFAEAASPASAATGGTSPSISYLTVGASAIS